LATPHEESHFAISLQIDFMNVRGYLTFYDNFAFHQGAGRASITHSPT
jgi:NADH:ubiquinone oxidoreductase subunit E